MRRAPAVLLLCAAAARAAVVEAPGLEDLVKSGVIAYRQGRLLEALDRMSEVLERDPQNVVAKNCIWSATKTLRQRRDRAKLSEKELAEAGKLARRALEDRRRAAERTLEELRLAASRTEDLRSPTGVLASLETLGRSMQGDLDVAALGAQGQTYFAGILANLSAAIQKNVFVSRKDHLRAEGYLAYYKKDWDRAADLWEKALREDPNDAQVRSDLESLKAWAKREKEKGELVELAAQASAYHDTGFYARAWHAWREVLRRDPGYPGASKALSLSRVAWEKSEQEKKIKGLMQEADNLFRQDRTLAAAELWLEALQIDPSYERARVWLKLARRKLESATDVPAPRAPAASPAAPAPSRPVAGSAPATVPAPAAAAVADADAEAAMQFYKKGLLAYADGQVSDAIRIWKKALALNPGLNKAREAVKQGESELLLLKR